MTELLLSVEDSFMLSGSGGLTLAPDVPFSHDNQIQACSVIVERPDGARLPAKAELRLHHFSPGGFKLLVYLPGLDKADVPIGSKVWRLPAEHPPGH